MALCEAPPKNPLFTLTRVFRDKESQHYVLAGAIPNEMKEIQKKMAQGTILTKKEWSTLEKKFSKKHISLWQKKNNENERIFFLPNYFWLDDTIHQIKAKIFVYLSQPKKYILPQNQQIWIDIGNNSLPLGVRFEDTVAKKTIRYPPAIKEKIVVDKSFISSEGERTSEINAVNRDNCILNDIFSKNLGEKEYPIQIFLYLLEDEINWYSGTVEKPLWSSYFLKHWPFATKELPHNITRLYNDVRNQVYASEKIVSIVKTHSGKLDPPLAKCSLWQMIHVTRSKSAIPYRLRDIFNFLRTRTSYEMPFVSYISSKEKVPYISIFEPSVKKGELRATQVRDWIFKKQMVAGKLIPTHSKGKGITIKQKLFVSSDGKVKYNNTTTIEKDGTITINLSFDENYGANTKEAIVAIEKTTQLIEFINNNLLSKQGSMLLEVPRMKLSRRGFVLGEHSKIQYFNILTSFRSKKEVDFSQLYDEARKYKPFAETDLFLDDREELRNLVLKYRRISSFLNIPAIFAFIGREKLSGTPPAQIVELIVQRFGKSRQEAGDAFNEWYIYQKDPSRSKKILKLTGVSLSITRASNYQQSFQGKDFFHYKIGLEGIPSLFILRNCYQFLGYFVGSYFHPAITPEKKTVQILAQKGIEFNFGAMRENTLPEVSTNLISNTNSNNNSSIEIPGEEKKEEKVVVKKKKGAFDSTAGINIKDESSVDPTIRLRCEGKEDQKMLEKGVCKDICDDFSFKLRRLQQFEPLIFNFRIKRNNRTYSRKCGVARHPIVMAYDPAKNPKIDPKAITYAAKYQSSPTKPEYHYICPQAWCPICEIPIPLDKVKNKQTKKTRKGDCEVGTCPHGDHQVYINSRGKKFNNPGFINPSGNPSGLCMPCCFSTDQRKSPTYLQCTGEKTGVALEKPDWKYINRKDKIPLNVGRFGLLPDEVETFLEQKPCSPGSIKVGFDCLVRKGISPSPTRSFLLAITDVVNNFVSTPVNDKMVITRLVESLTPQLFHSLNSGRVKRIFGTMDNFKKYLSNPESVISDAYLWDFVSRPGVFAKNGFNLILFTQHSIHCPFGQQPRELYSPEKPTVLMIKFGNIYEPIYHLRNNNGTVDFSIAQHSLEPKIKKVLQFVNKGCSPYEEVDWMKMLEDSQKSLGKTETRRIKTPTLKRVLQALEKSKQKVMLQLIDHYSKVTAIVLENGLYYPVTPSRVRMDLPILTMKKQVKFPYLKLSETLKELKELDKFKLPAKPLYLLVSRLSHKVIALLMDTGRIIPIKETSLAEARKKLRVKERQLLHKLDMNNEIYNYDPSVPTKERKRRNEEINRYRYHNESFERYKYEISRYLQLPKSRSLREELEQQIHNKKVIQKIIQKINKAINATSTNSKKKIEQVIHSDYTEPLLRKACFSQSKTSCSTDPHCVTVDGKCLLACSDKTTFSDKMVDLLQRYPIQRDEILYGRVPLAKPGKIVPKPIDDEILLTGSKIDLQFQDLFAKEKGTFFLETFPDIDITQPTFEGVNKRKYLIVSSNKQAEIQTYSMATLSQHWATHLGPWFRLISPLDPCQSLYYSFSQIAKSLAKQGVENAAIDLKTVSYVNLRDLYTHYLLNISTEKVKEIASFALPPSENKNKEEEIVDVADFFNRYQDYDQVDTPDELVGRIRRGFPVYRPSKFDVYLMAAMMNVHVILLRKSISELVGHFVTGSHYAVLFYSHHVEKQQCIRFYLLQRSGKSMVSELSPTIKHLLPSEKQVK